MRDAAGAQHQYERKHRDQHFTESSYHKWPYTLFEQCANISAQSHAGKGEEERPSREIAERGGLSFVEDLKAGERRDQQEPKHKFGKLLPQESSFALFELSRSARCPANGEPQHHEPDHRVAGSLG